MYDQQELFGRRACGLVDSCVNGHAAPRNSMPIVLHHMPRRLAGRNNRCSERNQNRSNALSVPPAPAVGQLERGMDGARLALMVTHSVQIALAVFIGEEYTSAVPERPRARRRSPPPPRCTASRAFLHGRELQCRLHFTSTEASSSANLRLDVSSDRGVGVWRSQ